MNGNIENLKTKCKWNTNLIKELKMTGKIVTKVPRKYFYFLFFL